MAEDYYALLGVERDASEEAILRAYRERAAEHHPDVSDADDAEETFRRLNRAKAVLTDDERRRRYNRLGHERFVDQAAEGGSEDGVDVAADGRAGTPGGADLGPDRSGAWPADLGALLGQLFGGAFAAGRDASARGARASRRRAAGARVGDVDLRSAFRGSTKGRGGPRTDRASSRPAGDVGDDERECPRCRGRGSFVHELDTGRGRRRRLEACERCGGDGTVPE